MAQSARDLLAEFLEKHDFSESALARMAGLDPSTINKILRGHRKHPGLRSMLAIERATAGYVPVKSWPLEEPRRRVAE